MLNAIAFNTCHITKRLYRGRAARVIPCLADRLIIPKSSLSSKQPTTPRQAHIMTACTSSSSSSSNKSCCCPTEALPLVNNYQGIGTMVTIDGVETYVTGQTNSGTAIFVGYDIFGMSSNTKQFCDRMAKACDAVVAMPDLLDNDPWPVSNLPVTKEGAFPSGVEPEDGGQAIGKWVRTHHNCRLDRLETLQAVKDYLVREYDVSKVAAIGMCWGAKVIFVAAAKTPGLFDAIACVHGSFLDRDELLSIGVPICLLNSKDEPAHYTTDFKPLLEEHNPLNFVKLFPTMHHGWLGTRGTGSDNDFSNKEHVNGFNEGVQDLTKFFEKALA